MDRSRSSRSGGPSRRRRNRRAVLRWCGLLGLSGLAGCTRDVGEQFPPNEKAPVSELRPDLPVAERTDVLEAGITELSSQSIGDEEALTRALEEHGVTIESTERVLDALELEYVADRSRERGPLYGIGRIAGAYAALVESGYDARVLEITVLQPTGSAYGVAEVETKYAKRYNAGRLSAKEYGELIAGSIESERRA